MFMQHSVDGHTDNIILFSGEYTIASLAWPTVHMTLE